MAREDEYQRSGLGDLSEGLGRERGDYLIQRGSLMDRLPSEQQAAKNTAAPKIPSGVVPVYATLPANAGRFTFGQTNFLAAPNVVEGVGGGVIFSVVVPSGRVLYAKEFRVNVIDTLHAGVSYGVPTNTFFVSLYLNGNCEVFTQGIQVEALDNYYPTSIIAGPGDTVTMRVDFDFSGIVVPDSFIAQVDFIANLRGDILLLNDMPTPYTALRQSAIPVVNQGK